MQGVHHYQALIIWNVKGTYLKKRIWSKTMNSKITTNSQLSTTEPKKRKQKLSEVEQEQDQRNWDHMEGFQWGGGGEEWGERYWE